MQQLDFARYAVSLLVVLGLIILLAYLAKRLGLSGKMRQQKSVMGQMELLDTLYLDAKRKLMLVKCKNAEYILVSSGDQVQIIPTANGDKVA